MKIENAVKPLGIMSMKLYGPDGRLKEQRVYRNLIVQTGLNFLASALLNASASPFTHMAVGTGGTAPALGDTALETELARAAFSTASVTANVLTVTWTLAAGTATGALVEAGIFNAGVAGTMLSRVIYSTINKGALDSLVITWTVTIS